jgi:hypothetical protein
VKSQIEAMLKTYNLTSVVNFPTRIQQKAATTIDNIFIDVTKVGNYSICPIINGLSDHDAQSITLHSISSRPPTKKYILCRKINEYRINDFLLKLSYETQGSVFSSDNVNIAFNSFLDSYLNIFNSSFPLKRVQPQKKKKKKKI